MYNSRYVKAESAEAPQQSQQRGRGTIRKKQRNTRMIPRRHTPAERPHWLACKVDRSAKQADQWACIGVSWVHVVTQIQNNVTENRKVLFFFNYRTLARNYSQPQYVNSFLFFDCFISLLTFMCVGGWISMTWMHSNLYTWSCESLRQLKLERNFV